MTTTVWLVADIEGEPLGIFTTRQKAESWLEKYCRKDIAGRHYGDVPTDVELTWRDGRLGFVRTHFGRYGWFAISDEIYEWSLDPEEVDR